MLLQGKTRVLRRKSCFAGRINLYTRPLCPTTRQPFFFIPGPQAQSTQQRKICCCRCFFTSQKGEKAPISMPEDRCRMPAATIDISECTFFALLIYQFKDSHPGFLSCCSSTMYATFPRSETECLQNYCKIRRSSYDASQFSMQNSEVYMLHSFSSQVYSFQQRRQFSRENKSNICTFFV